MPKITNTKKQRADKLYNDIKDCNYIPHYESFGKTPSDKEIREDIKRWLNTWILPEIVDLIPELKDKK